jgi:hypothetical protein
MPTLRKYKPKGYRSGGAVLSDTPIPGGTAPAAATADEPALPPEPAAAATLPPFEHEDNDAVARAVAAQRRAEELQRQAAQPSRPLTIEEQIDAAPLSDKRKAFLKQHTMLAEPQNQGVTQFYYQEAVNEGLADDSDSQHEYILQNVRGHLERRERQRAQARAYVAPRAPEAQEEAIPQLSAPMPSAAPQPAKRSAPMAAPVSRDVPTLSGRPSKRSAEPHRRGKRNRADIAAGPPAGTGRISLLEK